MRFRAKFGSNPSNHVLHLAVLHGSQFSTRVPAISCTIDTDSNLSPSEKIMKLPSLSFGLLAGYARNTVISPAAMQISIDPAWKGREKEREGENVYFISYSPPLYSSFFDTRGSLGDFFLSVCRLFARLYVYVIKSC